MRLAWAVLGIIAALTCGWAVQSVSAQLGYSPFLGAAAYLAAWIPFLAALAVSFWGEGFVRALAELGLRFRPLDLLWGLGIGCLVRAIDAIVRLVVTGSTGLVQQPTLSAIGSPPLDTIAWGIVAPVIVAPLLEEIYFRGLLQRALADTFATFGKIAKWVTAVVLTSVVFAAVHALLLLPTPGDALLAGIATFVFALAAGTTAAATGRLGGAIVGHVVFNGLGVLLTWPA
ncbi:type II CAAX prenyl endopeptidase Rce1 family protein [Sinomonas sp. P47F7]|uniref:CPBP family glutamic-type intramembrane protease n=1 Tax=Sinomonas sp. P47F7 TaxID=3410987 RepID=UPI003BF5AD4D